MTTGARRTVVPYGAADKHRAVRGMFDSIAPGYDRVNRLMTLGLDRHWRRTAARLARVPERGVALDVGTGTGDLALALATSANGATAIGVDYALGMLARAPRKAREGAHRVAFAAGDGHRLPFADATFDAVASAFALRNFAALPAALAEMARVLAPGGWLVALEASPSGNSLVRRAATVHFTFVVPLLGRMVTGDRAAYSYLGRSVGAFAHPAELAALLDGAGLASHPPHRLAGGTILVHRARKPF